MTAPDSVPVPTPDTAATVKEGWNPDGPHIWREPPEESTDLYPGLVVHDGRHTGSITIGRSRLPINAIIPDALQNGWDTVEPEWSPTESFGFTEKDLQTFLYYLTECRGEFARLLLILADCERIDADRDDSGVDCAPWWQQPNDRTRVIDQLRRCLVVLEAENAT